MKVRFKSGWWGPRERVMKVAYAEFTPASLNFLGLSKGDAMTAHAQPQRGAVLFRAGTPFFYRR
jgi:hypothetical protein